MTFPPRSRDTTRHRPPVSWVRLGSAIATVMACLTLVGCKSGDSTAADPTIQAVAKRDGVTLMTPAELNATLESEDPVVINVCTSPRSGEIPGTDMAIAYDTIGNATDRLPADKDARIVLYCTGGPMSKEASETLTAMGYTNLIDLPGGTDAWRKAGLPIGDRTQ